MLARMFQISWCASSCADLSLAALTMYRSTKPAVHNANSPRRATQLSGLANRVDRGGWASAVPRWSNRSAWTTCGV